MLFVCSSLIEKVRSSPVGANDRIIFTSILSFLSSPSPSQLSNCPAACFSSPPAVSPPLVYVSSFYLSIFGAVGPCKCAARLHSESRPVQLTGPVMMPPVRERGLTPEMQSWISAFPISSGGLFASDSFAFAPLSCLRVTLGQRPG